MLSNAKHLPTATEGAARFFAALRMTPHSILRRGTPPRRSLRWGTGVGAVFAALALRAVPARSQCDWTEGFSDLPGLDAPAYAMTVFDDGGGEALYVAGQFSIAGATRAVGIARWNGSGWSPVGSGVNHLVSALTVFDDGGGPALYAGGVFTTAGGISANYIAKWNGSNWSALGSGMNSYVRALTVFDDGGGPALYAGGSFTTAGGVSAKNVAKWNGSSWSAVGLGMNNRVNALTVFDDGGGPALFAGGNFTTADAMSVGRIAKWNGSSWSALGLGMGGVSFPYVNALTVFDDGDGSALYVGGFFKTAGSTSANYVAKWNGSSWSALGSGMNDEVFALTFFDGGGGALYAGGSFTTAGGKSSNYIARWSGSTWSALGADLNGAFFLFPIPSVNTLTVFDDGGGPALYAGGNFSTAGSVSANRIAKWKSSSWSALGSGMNYEVYTLTFFDDGDGDSLYAGGDFTNLGIARANYIAKWNPGTSGWSALGSGMNGGRLCSDGL